ncbi:MAG: 4'-phosphopantetheinyl transferase superfamily protein [Deltaproteobacteria bacterium]|nr:4'-phosphopantetheinyl transferase superfamily protein [Deltaproteobacteria bacterium]
MAEEGAPAVSGIAPDLLVLAADQARLEGVGEGFLLSLLPDSQRLAISRYRRVEDRMGRLLARLLLGAGLNMLEGWSRSRALAALAHEPEGRPFLQGGRREISFSHAGRWSVCAIGDGAATGRVGVDVEAIRPLAAEEFTLVFSRPELEAIRSSPDPYRELIRRWTIKEAVLKARGRGFLEDPLTVDSGCSPEAGLSADRYWEHLPLAEGYWLTVAAERRWNNLKTVFPSAEALLALADGRGTDNQ